MAPRLLFLDLRCGVIRPMEPPTAPTVLCLGNFDGVHRAHLALMARARTMAATAGEAVLCGVFSFFRPSIDFTNTSAPPAHLTTLREKLYQMSLTGMDFACLCDFREVRHLSPTEFLHLLTDSANCRGAVCGYNFRFGAGGAGDAQTLTAHFDRPDKHRMAAVVPVMMQDGRPVSSTHIRSLLRDGDMVTAREFLGRPYALEATVVHGKHLGRQLGFPTANQHFPAEVLIPARGVYATLCHTPFGVYPGVSNVGCHPTVDAHARVNCETHVLGLSRDLYGVRMRVEFLRHLRPEMTFPDVEALISAIRRDAEEAATCVAAYTASRNL